MYLKGQKSKTLHGIFYEVEVVSPTQEKAYLSGIGFHNVVVPAGLLVAFFTTAVTVGPSKL